MRIRQHAAGIMMTGLALAFGGTAVMAAPASPYDGGAWRADYARLKSGLEKEYANLAWFGAYEGGVDLPALDRQTQAALRAARTDGEAQRAIENFVSAFHDGHFSILSSLTSAATSSSTKVERRPFDANDMTSSCAALGFLPGSAIAFSVPLESLPGFNLRFDGLTSVYRAGIFTAAPGMKIGVIRIQNFRMRAFPATCSLAWAGLVRDGKTVTSDAVREAAYALWFEAFRDEIAALRAEGATALMVDVGNNSGGDDTGDYFPRMLTDKPVKSAPLFMTASPTGTQYIDEAIGNMDDALKDNPPSRTASAFTEARAYFVAQKAKIPAATCDMSWVWHERRHYEAIACKRTIAAGYAGGYSAGLPKGAYGDLSAWLSLPSEIEDHWGAWTGPVYVLTDGKTYSSAEMFSAVVQDNGIGKTVGNRTGGDGCGFMTDAEPLVLSHSGIRVRMANCVRLRRDGTDEVAGILPDIPVLPAENEDDRQRAVRLLNRVAEDMRR